MNKRFLILLVMGVLLLGTVFFISRSPGKSLSSLALSSDASSLATMTEAQLRTYIADQDRLITSTQTDILTYQNNKKPAEEALGNLGSAKPITIMTEAELRTYIAAQDALITTAQANKLAAETALAKFVVSTEPACGINGAAGSYRMDINTWPDQVSGRGFCASGKLVGSEPLFPIKGGDYVSWKCRSEQDSTKEISCTATKRGQANTTPNPYLTGNIQCTGSMSPSGDPTSSTFTVNWTVSSTVPTANSGPSWYWSGTDYDDALITPLATKTLEKKYYSPGVKEIYVGLVLQDSEGTYTAKITRCAIELVSPSVAAQSDATLLPACGVNSMVNYPPDPSAWADSISSKGFCSRGVLSGSTPTFPQYALGPDGTFNRVSWTCVNQKNPSIKSLCSASQMGPTRYPVNTNQNADAGFSVSTCSGVRGPVAGSTTEDNIVWTSTQNSAAGSSAYSNGQSISKYGTLAASGVGRYTQKHIQRYPRGATLNPYVTYLYTNTKRWNPSIQAVTVQCPVTSSTTDPGATSTTIVTR